MRSVPLEAHLYSFFCSHSIDYSPFIFARIFDVVNVAFDDCESRRLQQLHYFIDSHTISLIPAIASSFREFLWRKSVVIPTHQNNQPAEPTQRCSPATAWRPMWVCSRRRSPATTPMISRDICNPGNSRRIHLTIKSKNGVAATALIRKLLFPCQLRFALAATFGHESAPR